ncbi:MAG: hypothetical protein F6K02_03045 [Moorea sp. SIO3A5]|uniref:hypothetical protein n=1 Tax=Moorena producens TaxID=1155739 RepID=UPI00141D65C7|nr:hypothetical protein [Moorena producens]NEP64458.1 hypothetical protein [Moorena sp. SIO3A5]
MPVPPRCPFHQDARSTKMPIPPTGSNSNCSLFPTPDSRLPIPDSRFPTPDSLLPESLHRIRNLSDIGK